MRRSPRSRPVRSYHCLPKQYRYCWATTPGFAPVGYDHGRCTSEMISSSLSSPFSSLFRAFLASFSDVAQYPSRSFLFYLMHQCLEKWRGMPPRSFVQRSARPSQLVGNTSPTSWLYQPGLTTASRTPAPYSMSRCLRQTRDSCTDKPNRCSNTSISACFTTGSFFSTNTVKRG